MKGLIKEGSRPYSWQKSIPERFRDRFDGKKKFSLSLDTYDFDEAVRRGSVALREFEARCGLDAGPLVNLPAVAGLIFDAVLNRHEYVTCREACEAEIATLQDDGHPLVYGLPTGGPTMDKLVAMLDAMCGDVELRGPTRWNGFKPGQRVSRTLLEQAQAWRKLPSPLTDKTRDQYVKDVRDFSNWFQSSTRRPAVGATITKKDVNAYVQHRMSVSEPKNSIMRRLSGLMKIYKSGQFSEDNPFSHVTSRIDIHGPELSVRNFTDAEVRHLLTEMREFDSNVQWVTRLALYSGMRLNEVCSLTVNDLKSVMSGKDKLYYWSFDRKNGRRAKTDASYRSIPVHPGLVPDLLKFIKGRTGYVLVETADKYGNRSAALSKRINRLIDRVCDDPAVREHSFRHSVISKLADRGVLKEIRQALVGHAGSDAHDGYDHSQRIRALYDAICLIEY